MTFDKEEHRAMLLEMLDAITIPAKIAEDVVELKRAIRTATIAEVRSPAMSIGA